MGPLGAEHLPIEKNPTKHNSAWRKTFPNHDSPRLGRVCMCMLSHHVGTTSDLDCFRQGRILRRFIAALSNVFSTQPCIIRIYMFGTVRNSDSRRMLSDDLNIRVILCTMALCTWPSIAQVLGYQSRLSDATNHPLQTADVNDKVVGNPIASSIPPSNSISPRMHNHLGQERPSTLRLFGRRMRMHSWPP